MFSNFYFFFTSHVYGQLVTPFHKWLGENLYCLWKIINGAHKFSHLISYLQSFSLLQEPVETGSCIGSHVSGIKQFCYELSQH